MTHLHIYRKPVVKATFVVGDNQLFSETVEARSIVLEGYKKKLLQ